MVTKKHRHDSPEFKAISTFRLFDEVTASQKRDLFKYLNASTISKHTPLPPNLYRF